MPLRQWTIECRANFVDPGKTEALNKLVTDLAVHLNASVRFLRENGQEPTVVVYSDDCFHDHLDLSLMKDTIGDTMKESPGEDVPVPDELIRAVQEMKEPRK